MFKICFEEIFQKKTDYEPRETEFCNLPDNNTNFKNHCISFASKIGHTFPEMQLCRSAEIFSTLHDHDYFKESPEETFLNYMNLLKMSDDDRNAIEYVTRGQSNNKKWLFERCFRLNSSSFGEICKTTDPEKLLNNLTNEKDLSHVPAIMHGRKNEINAVRKFEEIMGLETEECGTFVCKQHPHLSASQDRIINTDFCLEVKCPFTAKDCEITPDTVSFIYIHPEEGVKLKEDNNYYFQVQGQLLCRGRNYCYFVIYTSIDCLILLIRRDDAFIHDIIQKLNTFFNNYFKKYLLNKYLYKK